MGESLREELARLLYENNPIYRDVEPESPHDLHFCEDVPWGDLAPDDQRSPFKLADAFLALIASRQPTMEMFQRDLGEWGDETFPGSTLGGVLSHLSEEHDELQIAPDADNLREEAADCMILLLRVAHMQGFDLFTAAREKMAVNRQRTWHRVEGGYSKHDDALIDRALVEVDDAS